VCGVTAQEVRPFWGRALAWFGGAGAAAAGGAGLAVFVALRLIGYELSPRQLFWPPAWHELRTVQANLYLARAREDFAAGRVPEALSALGTAHEMNPRNYATGIMLAQFNRAGNPVAADRLYAQLLAEHPARAVETARAWYLSLLARGQLGTAAELATTRLGVEPEQVAAWTHALVFTSRHLRQPVVCENAAAKAGLPPAAVKVLRLEAQLQHEPAAAGRRQLLRSAPLPDNFPYAWVHRAERFIADGDAPDAMQLLRTARDRDILRGSDLVPLVLAALKRAGDSEGLARETGLLLSRGGPAELRILARHLIQFPDSELLARTLARLESARVTPSEEWQSAGLALFCAAGVAKDKAGLAAVRASLQPAMNETNQAGLRLLEGFFVSRQSLSGLLMVLPAVEPITPGLLYCLIEKYITNEEIGHKAPDRK
jgi:tetratricopeptide (TPR) repeat protein